MRLPNGITVLWADGSTMSPENNGKMFGMELEPGDTYIINSGGGGGFGDPLDRPAEKVAEDVRLGYISAEAATSHYGVVLDDSRQVDEQATAELRDRMRADRV